MNTRHPSVRVSLTGNGRGTVELDGRALPAVRAVTVEGAIDHVPTVTIQLAAADIEVYAEANANLDTATRATLLTLGWTPPDNGSTTSTHAHTEVAE